MTNKQDVRSHPWESPKHRSESIVKIAQNISMRFKDSEAKFSGGTSEAFAEYVENYLQVCHGYCTSDKQKIKFFHDIFDKNAKWFYFAHVASTAVNF